MSSLLAFLLVTGLSGVVQGEETEAVADRPVREALDDTIETYTESIPETLVEFKMVRIPGGSVTIDGAERSVDPFWMAVTETRWDAYDTYRLDEKMTGLDDAEADAISLPSKPYGFGNEIPGFGQEEYPVLSVARNAARHYARWLSAKTEHTYRLPTAAEWKHACQLGYEASEDLSPEQLRALAWFEGNAEGEAHPAASLEPNALGLYDQLGNAAELVAPPDGNTDETTEVWGGSYQSPPGEVHCSARREKTQDWQESDPQLPKSKWWLSDAQFVGFRVVRAEGEGTP